MSTEQTLAAALQAARALPSNDSDRKMILDQLQYLDDLLRGRTIDKSDLENISLGILAAREYEDSNPDFAEMLFQVEKRVVPALK